MISISPDSGFKELIEHINSTGRACRQIKVQGEAQRVTQKQVNGRKPQVDIKKVSNLHLEKLFKTKGANKPVTVTSLENYIVTSSSALNGSAESLEIRRYIKKLVDSGHIQVEGEKVLYGKGFSLCTSKN